MVDDSGSSLRATAEDVEEVEENKEEVSELSDISESLLFLSSEISSGTALAAF